MKNSVFVVFNIRLKTGEKSWEGGLAEHLILRHPDEAKGVQRPHHPNDAVDVPCSKAKSIQVQNFFVRGRNTIAGIFDWFTKINKPISWF